MESEAQLPGAERRRTPHLPLPFGRRDADRIDLTDRQREVLQLVAEGLENKEIAGLLGISEQGVKQQVSVLLKKFQVPSRASLTRSAITMRVLGAGAHPNAPPLENLFDRAPLLMAVTSGPDHRYILANREYVRFFGERGYVGRSVSECFPDLPDERSRLDHAYATGEPYREVNARRQVAMPGEPARDAYLTFTAEPLRDASGSITGLAIYGWDVTEEMRARERLERLSAEQSALLEQLPCGLIQTDRTGRAVVVNAVARRMLGGSPDAARPAYEQVGETDWYLRYASSGAPLRPDEAPSSRAINGWPFDDDVLVRRRDGADIRVRTSARPLYDARGNVVGSIITLLELDQAV
jgi:PAS domain-containing protein